MGSPTLFRAALGDRWQEIHPAVQALHKDGPKASFSGKATIKRGRGVIAGLVCWVFGFPPVGDDIPIQVSKMRFQTREQWSRRFGEHVFRSTCLSSKRPYHVRERVGLMAFEQELLPVQGGMQLALRRGWFLVLPVPSPLLPSVDAYEGVDDGRFSFDIRLATPSWFPGGKALLVHYKGWLVPDDQLPAPSSSPASN